MGIPPARLTLRDLEALARAARAFREFKAASSARVADPDRPRGNPHGLPSGRPIARVLRTTFRRMASEVRGWIDALDSPEIPAEIPPLDGWAEALAGDLATVTLPYRAEAGRAIRRARELPGDWSPAARPNESRARFAADSIVETTRRELRAALEAARSDPGPPESKSLALPLRDLWGRLGAVFARARDVRAPAIGEAEASNAAHAGAVEAVTLDAVEEMLAGLIADAEPGTPEPGAIPGKRVITDGHPCPSCIANEAAGPIPLGAHFPSGHGWPAFHLRCMCSIVVEDLPAGYRPRSFPFRLPRENAPAANPKDPTLLFTASERSRRDRDVMVWVSAAKLDRAWKKDESFYIAPGGTGPSSIGGRYQQFEGFLTRARQIGTPVEMSQVYVDEAGGVSFVDGRHRFAVLRDQGVSKVPVAVSPDAALRMAELYGAPPP
jgi:hypothetical protein